MLQSTTPRCLPKCLIFNNQDDDIWADSAYYNVNFEMSLKLLDYVSQIHERGYRNHPLNEEQKASNREKSKTRARGRTCGLAVG